MNSLSSLVRGPSTTRILHQLCKLVCAIYFLSVFFEHRENLPPQDRWLLIPVGAICFSLGVVILFRPYAEAVRADFGTVAVCTLSKLYYLLFDLSATPSDRTGAAGLVLLTAGLGLWGVSVMWLNTSFSILPARRPIRTSGPYRLVRHPIYTSYLVMECGVLAIFPAWRNVAVIIFAGILYVVRAGWEEEILLQSDAYRSYIRRTRYRLVPFVY